MKVGTLTIGQSPRSDLIPEMRAILGPNIEIMEKGALDGLDVTALKTLHPQGQERFLVTRMRDGTEVNVAQRPIIERLRQCLVDFQTEPVDIILLLCTDEFPQIESPKILLRPGQILRHLVQGLLNRGRLGVIVPSADQISTLGQRWEKTRLEVVAEAASPYRSTTEEMVNVATRMKQANVDLVVLDCIGFNQEAKTLFRKITQRPVLLPRTLMARIIREMV